MTLYRHDIPGGSAWSTPVRAGRLITLTALGQGANLSVLLVGSDRLDRLNIPDTLKAQMSACIRPPMVLMSDRGLALASVVASSLDWHDALSGYAHDRSRNDLNLHGIGGNGLIIELAKHGLGEADLHGCVNFFSKAEVDEHGGLRFLPGHAQAGDTVTLRAEQDLLMIAAATPHPMDDIKGPGPAGVRVGVAFAAPPTVNDEPARFRPESRRALEQTRRAFA
jgi:uncharacterized protein YcgI (DUF1989 family)